MHKPILLFITLLLITGCASIGPGRVHMDRGTYNNVVRDTDQEQLLMNIVRGRYLEVSQYIQVGSLTASYSLSQSLSGSVSADVSSMPTTWSSSLSPTVTYSDTPTISYIPLSSIEFAKSLMAPISMSNFLLLAHAGGYDHTMLFSIFLESIGNNSSNLFNNNGRQHISAQYIKYHAMLDQLNKLYRQGKFEPPKAVIYDKKLGAYLSFRSPYQHSPDALKLQKLLGIPLHSKTIIFMHHSLLEELQDKDGMLSLEDQTNKPRNLLYVQLRSIYAVIDLLGRGVRIPQHDIDRHMTRELINPDGSRHDWTYDMRHILTVYSSETEPQKDFLVKVIVHNHWFYIKSSDLTSKDTFDAVLRMLTLTSAVAASNNSMPVLTIPVSAGAP